VTKYCRDCGVDYEMSFEVCPSCGSILVIKSGTLFQDRYKIVRMLDMTSTSIVYLALDQAMEN